jgi:Phage integrase, N-terminal SAM-like domain
VEMEARVPASVALIRSRDAAGNVIARLGLPLADEYLQFLAGRCRPNTVLAVAYDLKVFFTSTSKSPEAVTSADVLAFMTAQRTGGQGRLHMAGEDAAGVSARTVRRRLSSVSGLYSYLQARGDVAANPVPRGLPTRRERQRPRQGVPLVKVTRTLPVILSPAEVDAPGPAERARRPGRGAPQRRLAPMHSRSWYFGVAVTGGRPRDRGLHDDEMREPHEQEAKSKQSGNQPGGIWRNPYKWQNP